MNEDLRSLVERTFEEHDGNCADCEERDTCTLKWLYDNLDRSDERVVMRVAEDIIADFIDLEASIVILAHAASNDALRDHAIKFLGHIQKAEAVASLLVLSAAVWAESDESIPDEFVEFLGGLDLDE